MEIAFDLKIAMDAPVGRKKVYVVYDDGKKIVDCGENLFADCDFEITETTN